MPPPTAEPTPRERIWQVVSMIPPGRVATYGQIAELAGLPRRARMVGQVLARLPAGSRLPWFRVVGADGRIRFPIGSAAYARQRALLERDGVNLCGARVDLAAYRWDAARG